MQIGAKPNNNGTIQFLAKFQHIMKKNILLTQKLIMSKTILSNHEFFHGKSFNFWSELFQPSNIFQFEIFHTFETKMPPPYDPEPIVGGRS